MNHLEELTTEWLTFNGYFTRTAVKVGKRANGGFSGELDVVGFNAETKHFVHVECSTDAWPWSKREEKFKKKLDSGREFAATLFGGLELPSKLDQVVLHGFAGSLEKHREIGGGRLIHSKELVAEILNSLPRKLNKAAVPESFPLLRTIQLCSYAGATLPNPKFRLIPLKGNP